MNAPSFFEPEFQVQAVTRHDIRNWDDALCEIEALTQLRGKLRDIVTWIECHDKSSGSVNHLIDLSDLCRSVEDQAAALSVTIQQYEAALGATEVESDLRAVTL